MSGGDPERTELLREAAEPVLRFLLEEFMPSTGSGRMLAEAAAPSFAGRALYNSLALGLIGNTAASSVFLRSARPLIRA